MAQVLVKNIGTLLTLQGAQEKQGRKIVEADLSIQNKQAMILNNGTIQWIGPQNKIPKKILVKKVKEISVDGKTIVPGFIECHTHTVFAGSRAHEFELRNQGMTYQEIAAKGGGILSTMKKTRTISQKELLKQTQSKVDDFINQGVSVLEVKSGYALNLNDELKMLEVIKKLNGPKIVSTFLGAHALPPEYKSYEEYLQFLGDQVLPVIKKKKLATRVDVFIEKGFFPLEASKKYLAKAKQMGFQTCVHADQLSLSGGTSAAIELSSLSADHVIQISEKEIKQLAKSETTAVLLPAADFYLKCNYPPARKLIDAGARVALATDFNPGSSPTQDLQFTGLLARTEMKMTLPEVISAYTVGAAWALGLGDEHGSLSVGRQANFNILNCDWTDLFYSVGKRCQTLYLGSS